MVNLVRLAFFLGEIMDSIRQKLYKKAIEAIAPRTISTRIEAGGVAAAIESESGKIYTGVCIDTACTLGICAERNAIFNMITNGEDKIKKVLTVSHNGKILAPCGACRELMAQMMPNNYKDVLIMLDFETNKVATLDELLPSWWS